MEENCATIEKRVDHSGINVLFEISVYRTEFQLRVFTSKLLIPEILLFPLLGYQNETTSAIIILYFNRNRETTEMSNKRFQSFQTIVQKKRICPVSNYRLYNRIRENQPLENYINLRSNFSDIVARQ